MAAWRRAAASYAGSSASSPTDVPFASSTTKRSRASGAEGVLALPYFLGEKTPLNDPNARGAFVGLHLGHTRAHLYRAVLEAVAYGFRHHVEVFTELGHPPQRIRVSDGGARSAIWTQIIADVLNAPLEIVAGQGGAAVGAAFVAGMAMGSFSDWREIERFAEVGAIVQPRPCDVYERGYLAYRSLYPALQNLSRDLAPSLKEGPS